VCEREEERKIHIGKHSKTTKKKTRKNQEREKRKKRNKRTVNSVNNDWQCCDKIKCLTHPNIKE